MRRDRLEQLEAMARAFLPEADAIQVAPTTSGRAPFMVNVRVGTRVCALCFDVSVLDLACKILANKLGIGVKL